MNKKEIAETLRTEVGYLEVSIKKVQERCDRLKRLVLDLEEEIELAEGKAPKPAEPPTKFRKAIDAVFGEEPKARKR